MLARLLHLRAKQHKEPDVHTPFPMQIAPKDDELKACQQYTGRLEDLSPPEQFLLTMSTVPRLHDKINALILMAQFQVRMGSSCLTVKVQAMQCNCQLCQMQVR
jgi:Formin Homology 2 Domain